MAFDEEREAIVVAGRRLADAGLVVGTAGNLSVRIAGSPASPAPAELVLITPTGAVLADLEPSLLTVIDLGGRIVDGALAPTSEVLLHLAVYRATAAAAIAHAHPMASTAVACTRTELPPVHYLTMVLGGPPRVAPYALFGSAELAGNVVDALTDECAALMANHGSVAYGATMPEACERLELLDWLSELYARAVAVGDPRLLDDAELRTAREAFLTRNYGTLQPVDGRDRIAPMGD